MRRILAITVLLLSFCTILIAGEKQLIRAGHGSYGSVVYTIEDQKVREGYGSYGKVLYTIDGKYIREGYGSYGKVLYTIDGNYIREGYGSYGKVLYTIDGNYIGTYKSAKYIADHSEEIVGKVLKVNSIYDCCNGRIKQYKGYVFINKGDRVAV